MQPKPAPPVAPSPLRKSAAESTPGTPAQPPEQMQDAAASKARFEKQRQEFSAAAASAQRKLEERKGAAMKDQEALLKRAVADAQVEMERLRKQARADEGRKIDPAPEALEPPQITGWPGRSSGQAIR